MLLCRVTFCSHRVFHPGCPKIVPRCLMIVQSRTDLKNLRYHFGSIDLDIGFDIISL